MKPVSYFFLVFIALCALFAQRISAAETTSGRTDSEILKQYRQWIEQMKTAPRGPFKNVRWFCKDGTILPPKAYACKEHGGGYQHGNYSDKTRTLRQHGYYIANFLAGVNAESMIKKNGFMDEYNQILLEKFLIRIDNGWIWRKAQFYRGAVQEEDEREGARVLLTRLSGEKEWTGHRYLGLRTGVQLLPQGKDTASAQEVRQLAAALAETDRAFIPLRVKIHGTPEASDAQRVRDYIKEHNIKDAEKYHILADEIDQLYKAAPLADSLRKHAGIFSAAPWLQTLLNNAADELDNSQQPLPKFRVSAKLLADLRQQLHKVRSSSARLKVLDLSMEIEAVNYKSGTELRNQLEKMTRKERVELLGIIAQAAYGTGVINYRSYQQIKKSVQTINKPEVDLGSYIRELNYLGRVPGWGTQGMRFQFYESMLKLGEIEPLTVHFIQDQLRGSPLLLFSQVLNDLSIDVNHLSGVKHTLFGNKIGVGFNALNPGLVRGVLHTDITLDKIDTIKPDGIYLLPETVSDLPPLAGIITAGEGNPLSHVQLLARNLGIPNVSVDESLIPELKKHNGQIIVMAVSPSGLVQISADSKKWQKFFKANKKKSAATIRPDLEKLDIKFRKFISLDKLRASDSGRIVGPKAANLGELKHVYPDKVADGMAIPFGIFRQQVLNKPYKNSGKSVYDWMLEQYSHIKSLHTNSAEQHRVAEAFRAELYQIILTIKLDNDFKNRLKQKLDQVFGRSDLGIFVRSDTNVEDLPGFTGAGLNLTMPNVIGFENLLTAIRKVWASPFTQRAFAWRQSHMDKPEYVYPSILLLRSVPNEKSGVMVTEDIDTGDRNILSVAVNEGVGGAVDGQSAESLRINMQDGSVRVLATATAPYKKLPSPKGGMVKLPVSGSEEILKPDEIKQLISFAKGLPKKFPSIVDDQGRPAPADVEFGFLDGKLHLFQLRPFLQNDQVQGLSYLVNMDKALHKNADTKVNMLARPK